MTDRVVVLVDMDCFYVQVEQKLQPEFKGKPCAVVQYNNWRGGGLLSVNYEARALGVERRMRGDEAKAVCSDIHLFRVPEVRGKADLTRYRDASVEVMEILCQFSDSVERASIDEAYLDMTAVIAGHSTHEATADKLSNTFVVGWGNNTMTTSDQSNGDRGVEPWLRHIHEASDICAPDVHLATAAVIVEKIRATVFEQTGFLCSAGIAHNKMLSKLACGLHKPNSQTILPQSSVSLLYKDVPVSKVRNLGGKLGEDVVKILGIKVMSELENFSESYLQDCFGEKTGSWLYQVARGIDSESVISRQLPKSIGCGKNFPGKSSLSTYDKVHHWVLQLAEELEERLAKDRIDNKRVAKTLTVSVRCEGDRSAASRTCTIYVYKASQIASDAIKCLQKLNTASPASKMWSPSILSLSMSASKFVDDIDSSTFSIQKYFSPTDKHENTSPIKSNMNIKAVEEQHKNIAISLSEAGKHEITSPVKTNIGTKKEKHEIIKGNSLANSVSSPYDFEKVNKSSTKFSLHNLSSLERKAVPTEENSAHNKPSAMSATEQKCSLPKSQSGNGTKKQLVGFFARKMAELSAAKSAQGSSRNEAECSIASSSSAGLQESDEGSKTVDSVILLDTKKVEESVTNNQTDTLATSIIGKCFPAKEEAENKEGAEHRESLEEFKIKCPLCAKMVLLWEKQEHEDFHLASQLQIQFDSIAAPIQKSKCSEPERKARLSRKRPGTRKRQPSKKKSNIRTLDSYLV